jgi:hypothetical protein
MVAMVASLVAMVAPLVAMVAPLVEAASLVVVCQLVGAASLAVVALLAVVAYPTTKPKRADHEQENGSIFLLSSALICRSDMGLVPISCQISFLMPTTISMMI